MSIMTSMSVMPMLIMVFVMTSVCVIFCLTEHVCLVPSCLYKYLESGIEMDDKDKKHECNNTKYSKKNELDRKYCKKGDNARYHKRYHQEYPSDEYCSEIEEYHCKVEPSGNTYMSHGHASRLSECYECLVSLKYNKKLGICETHIEEE